MLLIMSSNYLNDYVVQENFGDITVSIPDRRNKASLAIRRVTVLLLYNVFTKLCIL